MSKSYYLKRTAPETYGIFERGERHIPTIDGLMIGEATDALKRAATDPNFSIVDHFYGWDDQYDPAQAEAEMYAEFCMSWISGGGSKDDVGRAWAEYGDHWNGVELVGV